MISTVAKVTNKNQQCLVFCFVSFKLPNAPLKYKKTKQQNQNINLVMPKFTTPYTSICII